MPLNRPPFRRKGQKARNKAFKECVDRIYYSTIDLDTIVNEIRRKPSDCVYDKISFALYMFDLLDTRQPENAPLVSFCIDRILWQFSRFLEISKDLQKEFPFFLPYCLIPEPELPGIEIGVFLAERGIKFLLNNHGVLEDYIDIRTQRPCKKEDFLKKYNVLVPEGFKYNLYSHYHKEFDDDDDDFTFPEPTYFNIFWKDFYQNGELSSEVPCILKPLP